MTYPLDMVYSPSTNPMNVNCAGGELFQHLTSRWTMLTLFRLEERPARFHVLRDDLEGVSEKVLTQTLRNLLRDGLIARSVEPTIPPKVTYSLTIVGTEAARQLRRLVVWIEERAPDVAQARRAFDDGAADQRF